MNKNSILIVVDMQNDFTTGTLANEAAKAIIPAIQEKCEKAKNLEIPILFTQDTHTENYLDTLEGKKLPIPHCIASTKGWEIVSELKKYITDNNTIHKPSFGFLDWQKKIEQLLPFKPEEIEICGTCTDICVISNALILKAIYPETNIIVDHNAVAGLTFEKNEATLEVMRSCQIDII